jgi:hypothetical protein
MQPMRHTELFACGNLAPYVNLRSGIFADQHGRQSGAHALRAEACDVGPQFCEDFVTNFQAIENSSGHEKRITRASGEFLRREPTQLFDRGAA